MKTRRQKTLRPHSQKTVQQPVRRVHLTVQRRQPAGRLKPDKKPVKLQKQRPGHASLKRPRQQTRMMPDNMLKPPEWLMRPPETFLNVLRLLRLVLKRPGVWQRMPEALKVIPDRKVMQALVEKQVHKAHKDHAVKQDRWGRKESGGFRGLLVHEVKPGPEVKKEPPETREDHPGRKVMRDLKVTPDQPVPQVKKVSRENEGLRESRGYADLQEREARRGRRDRKEMPVRQVRQVRKVNEAKLGLRAPAGSLVRRAAQQMWWTRRRHRRELCS